MVSFKNGEILLYYPHPVKGCIMYGDAVDNLIGRGFFLMVI